jgi:ribonuclease P protein component
MYPRENSLKGRYNFNKILREGQTFTSRSFILKYLKNKESKKQFAIIASNKFSKLAVVQNEAKRLFGKLIELRQDEFPENYSYIFIPKKGILDKDGKINRSVEEIIPEIDTFLSEVVVL